MTEGPVESHRKGDTVELAKVKQTLLLVGAALSLVVILIPVMMDRMYTKLDTIGDNQVQLASIQTQVTNLQRDIDRIMGWLDRRREEQGARESKTAAREVCSSVCTPHLYKYTLGNGGIQDVSVD